MTKIFLYLAEGVGFEPTDTFVSPVFKTGAFGRSATPPLIIYFLLIENNISLPYWSSKNYPPHPRIKYEAGANPLPPGARE